MATNKVQRYRLVSDDDGHDYLILADKQDDFQTWLDAGPYWKKYKGKDYSDCRCDSPSVYTFTDPQRDDY
jgi:hypothetical protein